MEDVNQQTEQLDNLDQLGKDYSQLCAQLGEIKYKAAMFRLDAESYESKANEIVESLKVINQKAMKLRMSEAKTEVSHG